MNTVQPKIGIVIPEKIHIKDIILVNAQINSDSDIDTSSAAVGFTLHITTKTLFNQENGCRIIFEVKISRINESGEIVASAAFTIKFDFEIDNLDDFVSYLNEDKKEVTATTDLGITLMGIAYSTTRGIILTRVSGTALEGIILPVIDPAVLLTDTNKSDE